MKTDNKTEKLKGVRYFFNIVLIILYLLTIYLVLSMFPGMPWYDSEGNYMLFFYVFWIPICIVSIVILILNLIAGTNSKGRVILLCLNALFIPVLFLLGAFDLQKYRTVFGIITIVFMVLYIVVQIIRHFKNKKMGYVPTPKQ